MTIEINPHLIIPESELKFSASRSQGPGGQHVNKVNSRVNLEFNVKQTSVLTPYQKRKIFENIGQRINKQGILRLQSQRHRTQSANRAELIEKFTGILQEALQPVKSRVPTRVPRQVREQRLEEKKRRTTIKRIRESPKHLDED